MRPFPRPTTASAVIRLSDACPSDLASLDDQTLLALWLARSLPGDTVDTVAAALIERFGGIGDVASAGSAALSQMPGMGRTPILDLKLLRALCVRLSRSGACKRPVLSSWSALVAYCRITLAHLPREQFRTLYLDRRNILLRDEYVADGFVDHAPVYPREVIRRALELSASALILVHNHPSGDPTPSQADIAITRQVVDAARLFGLQVHDHIIVGREGTASFRALGLI